jgi:hypothetical protein
MQITQTHTDVRCKMIFTQQREKIKLFYERYSLLLSMTYTPDQGGKFDYSKPDRDRIGKFLDLITPDFFGKRRTANPWYPSSYVSAPSILINKKTMENANRYYTKMQDMICMFDHKYKRGAGT